MKTTIKAILLIALVSIGVSCSKEMDYNLSESVYIEDTKNPGLPIYSEWGYNTFGAYIDRERFVSDNYKLPAKVIVTDNAFNFILNGRLNSNYTTLTFKLEGYLPENYENLSELHGKTIDLKSQDVTVTLGYTGSEQMPQDIIEGELIFKRVQKLYVDKELTKSIVSGTFHFKTLRNDMPISISNGRFDFGIGYDNFFNY